MSIEESDIVDAMGTDAESGLIHLTISDHLPWNEHHLLKLQAKLNTYLSFVESGEVYASYPAAFGKAMVIDTFLKYRPTPEAAEFLAAAGQTLRQAGVSFTHGPGVGGYVDDDA